MKLNFTEKEYKRLFRVFQKLDKDKSGALDPEEFLEASSVAMHPLLKRVIDALDKDRNGSISFLEFMQGLQTIQENSSDEEKIKFAFELYDINHDGFISESELYQVLKMTSKDKYDENELQSMI